MHCSLPVRILDIKVVRVTRSNESLTFRELQSCNVNVNGLGKVERVWGMDTHGTNTGKQVTSVVMLRELALCHEISLELTSVSWIPEVRPSLSTFGNPKPLGSQVTEKVNLPHQMRLEQVGTVSCFPDS